MLPNQREKINIFLDYVIGVVVAVAFLLLFLRWGLQLEGYFADLFRVADTAVLFVFLFEVIIRLAVATDKRDYLRGHWMDLIVFIPFIQFVRGLRMASIFVLLRQIILIFSLISRTKRLQKLISLLGLQPAQLMMVSFLTTILIGAFLLTLPISTVSRQGMNLVDALFTATSATCVTGLIVQDTGTFFSMFGQLVILGLIQIGALGIMTFSVALFLVTGRRVSRQQAMMMQDVMDQDVVSDILGLIKFIVKMTLFAELLGALFLFVGFESQIADPWMRLYSAVFHSVSAFCNAGFSLFPDSLSRFSQDSVVNLVISFLIIAGGLGFIVIKDLRDVYTRPIRGRNLGLQLHTKLVLSMTAILLFAGTVVFFLAERQEILANMPLSKKILASFFQSVTARTAGFNTVDIGALGNASLVSIIVLMFIGASSGSTGGGIKTSTFWIIIKSLTSHLQNKDEMSAFRRTIPEVTVSKAMAVFVLSLGLVSVFTYLFSFFEEFALRDILFETVSAFGTVGLSTGITGSMHTPGKLLITVLMFLGRLGPLTIVLAFSQYKRKINYSYAEGRVMVG